MTRIYTGGGDAGDTSLFDGTRTSKAAARVDLYGGIDELNSQLGLCVAQLRQDASEAVAPDVAQRIAEGLESIQHRLFDLGSLLADPTRCAEQAALPEAQQLFESKSQETLIDELTAALQPLREFVLPGGRLAAAQLHVARVVCRRIERRAVAFHAGDPLPASVLVYLNRLSDLLFTAARSANAASGVPDVAWQPQGDATRPGEDA